MEQNTKPLTLHDAAFDFAKANWERQINYEYSIHEVNHEAFKAGAQWQKEQDKELESLLDIILKQYGETIDVGLKYAIVEAIKKYNS